MKKLVLTLTATLACVAAFAQGKLTFVNDSVHLIYYDVGALAGDAVGSATASSGLTAAGDVLKVDLFYGTASDSLSLLKTTTVSGNTGTPGTFASTPITGLTSGGLYYFQVQVYDSTLASSYALAKGMTGAYYGASMIFTANASTSITATSIVNHNSPANSTWANGTFQVSGSLPGALGAIPLEVNAVPEPTSLALAGLGAAAMLIFRRRK